MTWKIRYENAKEKLLLDSSICQENLDLFKKFFDYEEYKLKRQNSLEFLDEPCYKTLLKYIYQFRNVNKWFQNKPWVNFTAEDIRKVYDDLEDGVIKNAKGKRFLDRSGYYSKIFKSKPFRLAGKSELAKDVIEFHTPSENSEVRFPTEKTFLKMTSVVSKPHHLLLLWLAWDIGENIGALLQLQKRDFTKRHNRYTNEPEYLVNLPKEKIKRSRTSRSEPTLYPETARFLDMILMNLGDEDLLFSFGHRQALKIIHNISNKTGARCEPNHQPVRWKDLRSGMASYLLSNGWSLDEVRARLGHTPSSKALNKYVNYLALDKGKPKEKLHNAKIEDVKLELQESQRQLNLSAERMRRQEEKTNILINEIYEMKNAVSSLRKSLTALRENYVLKVT